MWLCYNNCMTTNTTLNAIRDGDRRKARRDAIVAEMAGGIRQRATRIPSGKRYDRKVGKRVEA